MEDFINEPSTSGPTTFVQAAVHLSSTPAVPMAQLCVCACLVAAATTVKDVWDAGATLCYIQGGPPDPKWSASQFLAIKRAAQPYRWHNGQLYRCVGPTPGRSTPWRRVPSPGQARTDENKRVHEEVGHP